jgi:hypothetical protein
MFCVSLFGALTFERHGAGVTGVTRILISFRLSVFVIFSHVIVMFNFGEPLALLHQLLHSQENRCDGVVELAPCIGIAPHHGWFFLEAPPLVEIGA